MQSFENHTHQPAPTAVGYAFLLLALISFALRWFIIGGRGTMAAGLLFLCCAVASLLFTSRSYITRLQDRIIKLEMRMRTAPFLTAEQQRLLLQLDNKQIVALRFASDAELPALLERAVREKLPPKEIKRAIQTWVPDLDRT
jgi:Ca2+/Na+ antiporter